MKRSRLLVFGIWLASFLAAILIIWLFVVQEVHLPGSDRAIARVLPEYRVDVMKASLLPISKLYGSYLGGGITFWFGSQLWLKGREEKDDLWRLGIALICTLLFNAIVIWIFVQPLFEQSDRNSLAKAGDQALEVGKMLSWLVAPIQAFYFALPSKKKNLT